MTCCGSLKQSPTSVFPTAPAPRSLLAGSFTKSFVADIIPVNHFLPPKRDFLTHLSGSHPQTTFVIIFALTPALTLRLPHNLSTPYDSCTVQPSVSGLRPVCRSVSVLYKSWATGPGCPVWYSLLQSRIESPLLHLLEPVPPMV